MPDLTLPAPKTPLQSRAFALLRAIEHAGELARSDLTALNGGNLQDTKTALLFLREHQHTHICRYADAYPADPVYKFGKGRDARLSRRAKPNEPIRPPARDPLLAALFVRPARG